MDVNAIWNRSEVIYLVWKAILSWMIFFSHFLASTSRSGNVVFPRSLKVHINPMPAGMYQRFQQGPIKYQWARLCNVQGALAHSMLLSKERVLSTDTLPPHVFMSTSMLRGNFIILNSVE